MKVLTEGSEQKKIVKINPLYYDACILQNYSNAHRAEVKGIKTYLSRNSAEGPRLVAK